MGATCDAPDGRIHVHHGLGGSKILEKVLWRGHHQHNFSSLMGSATYRADLKIILDDNDRVVSHNIKHLRQSPLVVPAIDKKTTT